MSKKVQSPLMKLLILGAGGMLGHVLFSELKKYHQVWGTVRTNPWSPEIFEGYNITSQKADLEKLESLVAKLRPDVVINCIGIIKQLKESKDSVASIEVNSLVPHLISRISKNQKSKFIHFSTDCVFEGAKGNYRESDVADARDLYGLTKYMGEVADPHCFTFRTSIIGHELNSNLSLIDWFLAQKDKCSGYHKAIYTGFPTVEIAKVLDEKILPALVKGDIFGVYQLSSEPINKLELLKLVSQIYGKRIEITPSEKIIVDRSLNSDLFRAKLHFEPRTWPEMILSMYEHFIKSGFYKNKEYFL